MRYTYKDVKNMIDNIELKDGLAFNGYCSSPDGANYHDYTIYHNDKPIININGTTRETYKLLEMFYETCLMMDLWD